VLEKKNRCIGQKHEIREFVEKQTCAHSNCSQLREKARKQGEDSPTILGLGKENSICGSNTQIVKLVETPHCAHSNCSRLREKDVEKDEDSWKIWMSKEKKLFGFQKHAPNLGRAASAPHPPRATRITSASGISLKTPFL